MEDYPSGTSQADGAPPGDFRGLPEDNSLKPNIFKDLLRRPLAASSGPHRLSGPSKLVWGGTGPCAPPLPCVRPWHQLCAAQSHLQANLVAQFDFNKKVNINRYSLNQFIFRVMCPKIMNKCFKNAPILLQRMGLFLSHIFITEDVVVFGELSNSQAS